MFVGISCPLPMRTSPLLLALALSSTAFAAGAHAQSRLLQLDDLLDVRTPSLGALSDDGRWAVALMSRARTNMGVDYHRSFGDPTYATPTRRDSWIMDTQTGERVPLFAEPRVIGATAWSPDHRTLAVLVQRADDRFDVVLYDRVTRRQQPLRLPAGRYAFGGSRVRWSTDGAQLYVSLRSDTWRTQAAAEFARLTTGPRIVQSSTEPFLAWNGLQRLGTIESVVRVERQTGAVTDVLPEAMRQQWQVTRDGQQVVYTEDITSRTDYDVIGGTEQQLLVRPVAGGAPSVLFPSLRTVRLVWDRSGRRYAWLQGDQLFTASLADTARVRLAGDTTSRSDTTAAARARRAKARFTPVSWIDDTDGQGTALVATTSEGLWVIDAATRATVMVIATSDSQPSTPRVRFVGAVNGGRQLLLTAESRMSWDRALLRFDRANGRLDTLLRATPQLASFTVSADGGTVVVGSAAGNRPGDLWALRAPYTQLTRLTDANPQLAERALGATELLSYLDVDGTRQYGVVHYPANFEKGRRYPTVFLIYEDFFADSWDAFANLLNANGYLVVKPSVRFDIGYPGEAWVKGVTAAANRVIEMGIADSARLGVQGTSYGGYATNLLITQTNRFKAAVNVSGKVDLVSFYTDSPRLGVRNVHAAEKSQDRIGATMWQQPQKYIAHSAVMFADRITTPLLLVTGELDANVPAINTREMYFALRRLGKEVTWVTYAKGGHGMPLSSLDDWTDYHTRILSWYAQHLKGERPAAVNP